MMMHRNWQQRPSGKVAALASVLAFATAHVRAETPDRLIVANPVQSTDQLPQRSKSAGAKVMTRRDIAAMPPGKVFGILFLLDGDDSLNEAVCKEYYRTYRDSFSDHPVFIYDKYTAFVSDSDYIRHKHSFSNINSACKELSQAYESLVWSDLGGQELFSTGDPPHRGVVLMLLMRTRDSHAFQNIGHIEINTKDETEVSRKFLTFNDYFNEDPRCWRKNQEIEEPRSTFVSILWHGMKSVLAGDVCP